MPAKAVTVTATYKDLPPDTYSITVQNDGNGTANANVTSATAGTEITLTETPNAGYQFKQWQVVSGGVTITGNKFIMPAQNVTVKAIFEEITVTPPTYTVTVTGGTGGGDYAAGATVSITANAAPAGQQFDKWTTSGGVTFADATAAGTTFNMPAKDVTVTATYKTVTGVETAPVNPLKAWTRDGLLHIMGLTAGETLAIYTAAGQLVYSSVATSEETEIPLHTQGVYIVVHKGNTLKVVF